MAVRILVTLAVVAATHSLQAQLPHDTQPLQMEGDIASKMVDEIDAFLLKQIEAARASRGSFWKYDTTSAEAFNRSIEPNRDRLRSMLGMVDPRVPATAPELVATIDQSSLIAFNDRITVHEIRWPVFADPAPSTRGVVSLHGRGLLLKPAGTIVANVVALPDADQSPEDIAGLTEALPSDQQFALRLAEQGCQVIVPQLVSRQRSKRNGRANLTNREYLYRPAFELGRHLIGYELQAVEQLVDWLEPNGTEPIGICGYGEGGMLALFAGALDTRVQTVCVSGAFGPREGSWQEPLDRNVFGLVREFGAAELAAMVQPRNLLIEASPWPKVSLTGEGGAPAELKTPTQKSIRAEVERALKVGMTRSDELTPSLRVIEGAESLCGPATVRQFLKLLAGQATLLVEETAFQPSAASARRATLREQLQVAEIDRHTQAQLHECEFERNDFMKDIDTSSLDAFEESTEAYRRTFRDEIIGHFDLPLLPFNAHSRKSWDTEKWTGHEVVLDVFPGVFAYGVLLVPKDLKPDEKRPVVVCQHGLEGRPTDTFLNDHYAYHDFAAKLCERGFITFAPQNCYIFKDRFRTLQRKANSIGRTLFSIMVPQHQQIVNWLKTQPNVDPDRIAFYGLSYGGKSAMRIPALVPDYCLSICSADFNEWVHKNATTREKFSYVWTGEYEIFEWNLGRTFNYSEMAALICPRPFMVERGHFDGVGTDEWVAFEYAKVRNLYAAKLGIGDRTEIEWFVGPHTINGKATFDFLHRHLQFEQR